MTIILEISKQILLEEIAIIYQASLDADSSLFTQGFTFIGFPRDMDLASLKRGLLMERLAPAITDFTDKEHDEATFLGLRRLLDECREAAKTESDRKKLDEGRFGPSIRSTEALLTSIYRRLGELKLCNIPHDEDPLNQFRFALAHYSAEKIKEDHRSSSLVRLVKHPHFTHIRALTQAKEMMLEATLQECIDALSALNHTLPGFMHAKKTCVLTHVELLRQRNKTLCESHAKEISLGGIEISIAPLQPSLGALAMHLSDIQSKLIATEPSDAASAALAEARPTSPEYRAPTAASSVTLFTPPSSPPEERTSPFAAVAPAGKSGRKAAGAKKP